MSVLHLTTHREWSPAEVSSSALHSCFLAPYLPSPTPSLLLKSSRLPSCQIRCLCSSPCGVSADGSLLGLPVRTLRWLPSFRQDSPPSHLSVPTCISTHSLSGAPPVLPQINVTGVSDSPNDDSQVYYFWSSLPSALDLHIQLPAWGSCFPASEPCVFSDACPQTLPTDSSFSASQLPLKYYLLKGVP